MMIVFFMMPLVDQLVLKFLKLYYLVDAGYCNSSGFLAPYHGHSTVDVHNQEINDVEYGRGKNKRFWTKEES
ncbi:hypothetical protein ZIOFF_015718 [Zingiber officinale]|uniref:Uncharacterized protein n=1 Tax=Zingiber officinale TaxID=94328 RepID=A0A8J5LWP0_ZINOF|nr:hypothetical protein ZIOFF_015718 [Zingiber officinale]